MAPELHDQLLPRLPRLLGAPVAGPTSWVFLDWIFAVDTRGFGGAWPRQWSSRDDTLMDVRGTVRTMAVAIAVVTGSAITACGSGHRSTPVSSSGSTTSTTALHEHTSRFLVRTPDEWTPRGATYPAAASSPLEPSLDWYVAYERPPPSSPQRVRLSGHRIDLGGLSASLKGFSFHSVNMAGGKGLAGRSADPIGPSVVLLPLDRDYSAMALSYELSIPELVGWVAALHEATKQQWTAGNTAAGHG